MATKNQETAQRIVDRMVEIIDTTGFLPWAKPWGSNTGKMVEVLDGETVITIPVRHWSRAGRPYHGINTCLLAMSGARGEWITFNQCRAEGGHVNKGAKATTVVYWNMIRKEDPNDIDPDTGKPKVKTIPLLKSFNLFNVERDTDLKVKHHPADEVIRIPHSHWEPAPDVDPMSYDAGAEAVIADYLARSKGLTFDCHGSAEGGAYYMPGVDRVVVPDINLFSGLAEYYSTTFHELGHSTGHSSRLNRFSGQDACAAFGSESYSREELVAEITAASILSELGLEEGNSFRNSAAYVKSWAKHIKEDPMMFVTAASRAEKAIDLILGRTPAATT